MADENRRTVDQARMLLLVAAGGESPDAPALQQHAAQDHDTARAGGIRCVQSGADFHDDAEAEGAVSAQPHEKRVISRRCVPAGGETGPSRRRWKLREPKPG